VSTHDLIRSRLANERGIGLVAAMMIIALLAILVGIIAGIAVNERRSSFNESLHSSSLVAADSGTEEAIAWLLLQREPPSVTDWSLRRVRSQTLADLGDHAGQRYEYDMGVALTPGGAPDWGPAPGYSTEGFVQVSYDVISAGEAGLEGRSDVTVIVSKIFSSGY